MENNTNQQQEKQQQNAVVINQQMADEFALACKQAEELQLVNNTLAVFNAANVVATLDNLLTDDIMKKYFMPLAGRKIGFLTDRVPTSKNPNPTPYGIKVVKDAIIDAVSYGLLPTNNQFNIIAGRMYPTKEGYTTLLKKLGVQYIIDVSYDKGNNPSYAEIPCKINYNYKGEKNSFTVIATVKKDSFATQDALRGKAERKAKKSLYEFITGKDLGEAEESYTVIEEKETAPEKVARIKQQAESTAQQPNLQAAQQPQPQPAQQQVNKGFDQPQQQEIKAPWLK